MSNQAVGLVLGGDRNSANAGVHSVGERKIDDARFSAEIAGRLGASIGQPHKATAAPASKHEGKSVSRKGLMSVCSHLVLPYNARSDSSCSALWPRPAQRIVVSAAIANAPRQPRQSD